jgi:FAD/FMN-containing dehydrogenase
MTELSFEKLEAALPGKVSRAGDARYAEAVAIWNGAIARRPRLVAHCENAEDVRRVLGLAVEHNVEVSVRGGGHNFAGSALTEGGITIDLSPQRSVIVDAKRQRARCGGGTRWSELDAACQAHGLAVTGGVISHTGVGGLTLGGGVGWLNTKLGLSCDNLLSAEVVTADGRILRASERENADLFWALRGGGGNFGVVTEFEFQLAPIGPIVQLGAFFYEVERGRDMLRFANQLVRELDDDTSPYLLGLDAPPAPFVPAQYHGKTVFGLVLVGLGAPAAHARWVEKVRATHAPLFELVTPIPYLGLQSMFDASAPWGVHGYERSVSLDNLSDAAIDVIIAHLPRRQSPLSFLPIQVLGGKYARASQDSVAFGGRRSTRFLVTISGLTQDPAQLAGETEWVRALWTELVKHAEDEGSYVNNIFEPDHDRVRAAYGAAKYERLAAIKAKYDPKNVFHLNPNIRPSAR